MTVNTDNRLITDTTVSKELWLCHQHYGWALDTIKEVIIAGFKSAFLPYREKADLLAEINRELRRSRSAGNGKAVECRAPAPVEAGCATAASRRRPSRSRPRNGPALRWSMRGLLAASRQIGVG